MPRRPCEAITIKSALCFLAAAISASDTMSDLTTTALVVTPLALAALTTASNTFCAPSVQPFSIFETSLARSSYVRSGVFGCSTTAAAGAAGPAGPQCGLRAGGVAARVQRRLSAQRRGQGELGTRVLEHVVRRRELFEPEARLVAGVAELVVGGEDHQDVHGIAPV